MSVDVPQAAVQVSNLLGIERAERAAIGPILVGNECDQNGTNFVWQSGAVDVHFVSTSEDAGTTCIKQGENELVGRVRVERPQPDVILLGKRGNDLVAALSLIHISEPTRLLSI